MKTISQRTSILVRKLRHLSKSIKIVQEYEQENEIVPEDVKEGYFAVVAAKKGEEKPMRLVVELSVLKHPSFLRLLKMAEEEYGFQQKGVLVIPCRPDELQTILKDKIGMRVL